MKLKNDIQVKAFLIRNKISFEKTEKYITIDETTVGETHLKMLAPYECVPDEEVVRFKKVGYFKSRRVKRLAKPTIKELLHLPPEPEKQPEKPFERPKGNYSNKQWNDL